MKGTALDLFSSRLAIGSVCLVAAYLAVCGAYNISPFVDSLVALPTWQVLVAVPVLSIAYAAGAVVIGATTLLGVSPEKRSAALQDFVTITRAGGAAVVARYESFRQEAEFLRACIPTFLLLAVSVIWSAYRVLRYAERWASIGAAVAVIMFTPVAGVLARRTQREMQTLVKLVEQRRVELGAAADGARGARG